MNPQYPGLPPYSSAPGAMPYPTGPGVPPYPPRPGAAPYPTGQGAPPYPTGPGLPPHPEGPSVPEDPPPDKTYPCGCGYPGDHKPDCMWSLWQQMQNNYNQTKDLMSKFMTSVNTIQSGGTAVGAGQGACQCPPGCHGRDLGEAMGLLQMRGVTVPWQGQTTSLAQPLGTAAPRQIGYPVESESRRMMEEQRRIKNTWAQFLNIFDMALDLANDVSKDRWEAARRRRERARLERLQRLEEQQLERAQRASTTESKEPDTEEDNVPQKRGVKEESKKEEKKVKEVKTTQEGDTPLKSSIDKVEETQPSDNVEAQEVTGGEDAQELETPADETSPTEPPPDEEKQE